MLIKLVVLSSSVFMSPLPEGWVAWLRDRLQINRKFDTIFVGVMLDVGWVDSVVSLCISVPFSRRSGQRGSDPGWKTNII